MLANIIFLTFLAIIVAPFVLLLNGISAEMYIPMTEDEEIDFLRANGLTEQEANEMIARSKK